MLNYVLFKFNGQTPGSLLLLLREPNYQLVRAEIEVIYDPGRESAFQAFFSVLPSQANVPRPDRLNPTFQLPQEVIHLVKTAPHPATL